LAEQKMQSLRETSTVFVDTNDFIYAMNCAARNGLNIARSDPVGRESLREGV